MRTSRTLLAGALVASTLGLAMSPGIASAAPKVTPVKTGIHCMLLRIEIDHMLDLAEDLGMVIIDGEVVDTGASDAYQAKANQLIAQYEKDCGTWWPR